MAVDAALLVNRSRGCTCPDPTVTLRHGSDRWDIADWSVKVEHDASCPLSAGDRMLLGVPVRSITGRPR